MKDVTKIISERATRFLPVDMKDRLKSAFNRNSPNTAPTDRPADDVPDYSAIFNANKPPSSSRKQRLNGPLDQTQLAEPNTSATMRNPARQIAQDIEEAEIVTDEPPASKPEPEAAWLKNRKAEAPSEPGQPAPTPQLADDAPDYSAIFKSSRPRPPESKPTAPRFDASAFDRASTEARAAQTEEAAPKPELSVAKAEARPEAPRFESAKREEAPAEKAKPRFFGDFGSTESVRLKVEKRGDDQPAAKPASSSFTPAMPPAPPESTPVEMNAYEAQDHMRAGFAYEAKPLERPRDTYRGTTEAIAVHAGGTSEQVNVTSKKESPSMDPKAQESDNGAAVRGDVNAAAASFAIERNSKFSGQLKFSGAIAIDGQVEGELVAERVVVHEGGVVTATVEGNTVVIAGTVKGDIYARNELEILPSGIVHGSVTAPAINVRRGGRVEGRCAIGVPRQ